MINPTSLPEVCRYRTMASCSSTWTVRLSYVGQIQIRPVITGACDHKHAAPHPIAREKASTVSACQ